MTGRKGFFHAFPFGFDLSYVSRLYKNLKQNRGQRFFSLVKDTSVTAVVVVVAGKPGLEPGETAVGK